MTFEDLENFIQNEMRMSHVYQPAMLRALIEQKGKASISEIAKVLLSFDQSQVEYYETRTKQMVGAVLTKNGIVEPVKNGARTVGYTLNSGGLTGEQRKLLIAACNVKIGEYIAQRGAAIWDHRANTSGYIRGSTRYRVLSRAKRRCELCGAHEKQTALHIDHIIPRSKGGSDDISNFQALCVTCNTNKRDADDTDFRLVLDSYADRDCDCLFCSLGHERIIAENELCIAIRDGFPVTEMHTLVIPKRHVADYFDLYQPEINAVHSMIGELKDKICEADKTVDGFNVGTNLGASAGQTIFHVHIHLIPRRTGDVENPRGGVRGVIPERQGY